MNLLNRDTRELECVYRMDDTPPFFLRSTISVSEALTASEWKEVHCGENPAGRGEKICIKYLFLLFWTFWPQHLFVS